MLKTSVEVFIYPTLYKSFWQACGAIFTAHIWILTGGEVSPQFSFSDLAPILQTALPIVLSTLQQQGYQPAQMKAQSQGGELTPQFSFSDLVPIIQTTLPVVLSALQQQGYQPAQMKAQSQAGGLTPQFSFNDLVPIIQTALPVVLSALQQQGYQLGTSASQR